MSVNGSICPPLLYPLIEACGSDGICVNSHECECPPGWSGFGDFVLGSPNCNIHIEAVRFLWLPIVVFSPLVSPIFIEAVLYSARQNMEKNKWFFQSNVFCFSIGFLIQLIANFMEGVLKLHNPLLQIGQDTLITILYSIGVMGFSLGVTLFLSVFLDLNMKQVMIRRNKDVLKQLYIHLSLIIPVFGTLLFIGALLPIGMLFTLSTEFMYGLVLGYYVIAGTVLLVFASFILPRLLKSLLKELEPSDSTSLQGTDVETRNKMNNLHSSIQWTLRIMRLNVIPNVLPRYLMGCWPLLQSGSSYWLPVTVVIALCITSVMVRIVNPNKSTFPCRIQRDIPLNTQVTVTTTV